MKAIPNPDDMHGDVPMVELPFYKWLEAQAEPSDRFPHVLYAYFETDDLRGKLTEDEATSYKHIHAHYWRRRLQNKTYE